MYISSNSFLHHLGEYNGEMYSMEFLNHKVAAHIDLKVFGEGEHVTYIAHYVINNAEGKISEGACMNRPTKEATLLAVEEEVIKAVGDKNHHWS
ncbi:MAG: hypothetical protein ACI35V_01975 [Sphingobacterium composti]